MKIHNLKEFLARRRELRKQQTLEESMLWSRIRNKNLGYKFRRQHSIGYYIADFYCPQKKLVIEIDGSVHNDEESKKYDELRDGVLKEFGIRVLRIKNNEVRTDLEKVIVKILHILETTLP